MANTEKHRYGISDVDYERIEPCFPASPAIPAVTPPMTTGVSSTSRFRLACTGAPWEDLPGRYGKSNSVFGNGETISDSDVCHPGLDYLRSVELRSRVGISPWQAVLFDEILTRAEGD